MSEYPKSPTDRVLVEWQGTFLQVIQNWLCVGKEAIENLGSSNFTESYG
jgi:hypothetical protein